METFCWGEGCIMSKLVVSQLDRSGGSEPIRVVSDEEAKLYDKGFVFPVERQAELEQIINKREELRQALVNSMSLYYEFCNKLSREGRR